MGTNNNTHEFELQRRFLINTNIHTRSGFSLDRHVTRIITCTRQLSFRVINNRELSKSVPSFSHRHVSSQVYSNFVRSCLRLQTVVSDQILASCSRLKHLVLRNWVNILLLTERPSRQLTLCQPQSVSNSYCELLNVYPV